MERSPFHVLESLNKTQDTLSAHLLKLSKRWLHCNIAEKLLTGTFISHLHAEDLINICSRKKMERKNETSFRLQKTGIFKKCL